MFVEGMNGSRSSWLLAVAATAVAIDQVSKWAVIERLSTHTAVELTPFLNLFLHSNAGVSFGLFSQHGEQGRWLLTALAILIIAGLVIWALRARHKAETIALGTVAGGALGNVIDRVRHGAVTDFIDVHAYGWHWPTFNLADVAVTCGMVALLLHQAMSPRSGQQSLYADEKPNG